MAKEKAEKAVDLFGSLVNSSKLERAKKAVDGGAKPGSAELTLKVLLSKDFQGDELVVEIYKGLGGLVNAAKAAKNRENEKKDAARKRSR